MNIYTGMSDTNTTDVLCDFRSDTVTRPDAAMRQVMADADVGDDVYGEDPQVNLLEGELSERLGKEAGLFLPTGTQSNLASLLAHCGRGDEAIVGNQYHIYHDEAAGASVLGGIALFAIPTMVNGALDPADITAAVKDDDPHYARSRLLCLENTVSGQAIDLDQIRACTNAGRAAGLSVHLDGARFFNAITALECDAPDLAGLSDTVSVCLSKGLGAPAGSVLVGPKDVIARARRYRKMLGGAMRQSGVLAAAGRHTLAYHVAGLKDDHQRAAHFGAALIALGAGDVKIASNMVFFTPADGVHGPMRETLAAKGIVIGGQAPTIRMVLHRDINDASLEYAISGFRQFFGD
jgi:threonine aldolase